MDGSDLGVRAGYCDFPPSRLVPLIPTCSPQSNQQSLEVRRSQWTSQSLSETYESNRFAKLPNLPPDSTFEFINFDGVSQPEVPAYIANPIHDPAPVFTDNYFSSLQHVGTQVSRIFSDPFQYEDFQSYNYFIPTKAMPAGGNLLPGNVAVGNSNTYVWQWINEENLGDVPINTVVPQDQTQAHVPPDGADSLEDRTSTLPSREPFETLNPGYASSVTIARHVSVSSARPEGSDSIIHGGSGDGSTHDVAQVTLGNLPASSPSESHWDGLYQLPLLPAPPGFSHAGILIVRPLRTSSSVQQEAWQEAWKAELQKEQKLANASHSAAEIQDPSDVQVPKKRKTQGPETVGASGETETSLVSPEAEIQGQNAGSSNSGKTLKRKLSAKQRLECSEGTPCERCIDVSQSKRTLYVSPCWRSKLNDVELYRRRTQFGLFVYTYKCRGDALPKRSVRIINPEALETALDGSPITAQAKIEIENGSHFEATTKHVVTYTDRTGTLRGELDVKDITPPVISNYLDSQMVAVLQILGTSHQVVRSTLTVAEAYSRNENRKLLRASLRLFTARFLRRRYWCSVSDTGDYEVAWMDAPWRALPTRLPKTRHEADRLNEVLKDYLYKIEKYIIESFKAKVYARALTDWFELFLVTFIFQIVLSENLEMSFYTRVEGHGKPVEMPWSTFGGLRNYSSKAIGVYFEAIKGPVPFQVEPEEVSTLGQLGLVERQYLEDCPRLMKDSLTSKVDLGSKRSASAGHEGNVGSWLQWASNTILGPGVFDQ